MADSPIAPCVLRELVIVVGAEHDTLGGNLMRFMAQALRCVKLYGGLFELTTVLHFPGKRTRNQCRAFEQCVIESSGKVARVGAWSEVARHLNARRLVKGRDKRVQALVFFGHGAPLSIWLSREQNLLLTPAQLADVDASSFLPDGGLRSLPYRSRHVTSWACQTANAGLVRKVRPPEPDAPFWERNLRGSLAQQMANAWNIPVRAAVRKTEYSATWGRRLHGHLNLDKVHIDGAVWEPSGADGGVTSGTNSAQGEHVMPNGMFLLQPGQAGGYRRIEVD